MALTATAGFAQKQWTLQDCLYYAMANSITLKKQQVQKASATEDLKGAKAALLPTFSGSTNQSVGYRPWQDVGGLTVTNGTVNSKVDKTYYNGSYTLSGRWTVWNGGKNVNTIRLDKIAEQQAELSVEETANTIQEQIARLYIQILYQTEQLKVNEQTAETARKNEQRGEEMLRVGKMSKADVAQLTAQRATDEYNIVAASSQLATYKLQLKQLLEITDEEPFEVAVPDYSDEEVLAEVPQLQTVYEQALLTRPEMERLKLAVKSSDLNVKIAKAGWLPSLSMTAGVGTSTNSLGNNKWGTQMKTNFDTQLGLSVTVPIYDGRVTKTAVNKAKLQQQTAMLNLQDQEKQLYATIQTYWLDTQNNQEKYKAASASVTSEEESYSLLSEQFSLGLKNIVELMTGKDKLLSAQQSRLQSKYQAIYNRQMLRFYEKGIIK